MKKINGTQGLVFPVLAELGRMCPIGQEITLIAGLDRLYPGIQSEPGAMQAVLDGFSSRFQCENRLLPLVGT